MKILFAFITLLFLFPFHAQAAQEGIAVVVNDDVVTMSDVQDRMKLLIVSSGLPNNDEIRARMKGQVLNMLIDESLQMQEARARSIAVTNEDISEGFETIARQNNMTGDQFQAILKKSGINHRTLEKQIRAQIAWGKVVQKSLRPQVEVSDTDIDDRMDFLLSRLGKTQYQVAEIFLPVDGPQQDQEILALAQKLTREIIERRAPFQQVAAQFSQGAAAARGGDLGWVQEGELPDPINSVILGMKDGDLSQPIRSLTGYHILFLRGKRTVEQENLPTRDQVMQQIGTERLDRLQRRTLMDLKAEAFVEKRV